MDARRFDELLQRWQDGDAGAAELEELAGLLRQDPLRRRELVTSIRLELNLHRKYAPAKAASPARRRGWEAVAAALVLAISAFLVGRLLLMRQEQSQKIELPAKPAPIGLLRAIDLAVASGKGVPVKAEVESEDGSTIYAIHLALGKQIREVELDLSTGRVLEDELEEKDKSALAAGLNVPLVAAIGKALEAVPGRPVQAEAEIEGGKVVIEVRIIAGSAVRKIVVDGGSGQILRR